MKKIFCLVLMLLFFGTVPVFSQELAVVSIKEDLSSAVIRDKDNGQEWEVAVGETIGEWTIHEITSRGVTIIQENSDGRIFMTELKAPHALIKSSKTP